MSKNMTREVKYLLATRQYSEARAAGYSLSAARAAGYQGAATASGTRGAVRGKEGCALFLVYRDDWTGEIKRAWAGIAGKDGIKPMVFYRLGEDGKPVEIAP